MGDETPNTVNLDLNLGPIFDPSPENEPGSASLSSESTSLEGWLDGPVRGFREAIRQRDGRRWRSVRRQVAIPSEARIIALELTDVSDIQAGEGSVAAEERLAEVANSNNNNGHLEGEDLGKKEDSEKGNGDEGSFFDCNICLDLANDPIVTCCGHLFCWPCLYRWLHVHSDANECPVCKGEVTIKNVTPIYGRGNYIREPEEDSSLKIPARPQARRVESWRQIIQRTAFTIPLEEMIRRLGSRFELARDLIQVQPQNSDSQDESPERSNSLLNQILTSRAMRREHNPVLPSDDLVDSSDMSPTNSEAGDGRRLSSLLLRRSHSHRAAYISNLTSALNSERLAESYFRENPLERIQERPPQVDDRDSVSSIAAVIHSESRTIDTAIEIDSTVALSTLSSRRRNDASRISDMDSGDSREPRRRRMS